jgi:mRNA interferase MazF
MMSTTTFEFGDVVLVPFPFTNQTASKRRPAVVISRRAHHDRGLDLVLMAVTSQVRTPLMPGEVLLTGWQAAGLLKPSVTKPVLVTVEKSLILRRLGRLDEVDRQAVTAVLQRILGQ